MKKLHASYWNYDGNHHAGHDCERYDPHGFGTNVISFLAYMADNDTAIPPLTYADLNEVKVIHSKGDGFGHEVKVSAPIEIWEKARTSQQLEQFRLA